MHSVNARCENKAGQERWDQDYLRKWLDENTAVNLSFEKIWNVREQCIFDLSTKKYNR